MRARKAHADHDPSARALAAMAEASQRSRASEVGPGGAPSTVPPSRQWRRPAVVLSVILVVALIVAVLVGSFSSSITGRSRSAPPASAPAPHSSPSGSGPSVTLPVTGSPTTVPASTLPTPASSPTTVAASTTTLSTTPPTPSTTPPSGGGPVLSALEPSTGAPGQVLIVSGSNLLSPSGQITAQFGGQTALIACPTSTSCLIQVPSETSTPALVTVTTDGGTSNPLTFSYG